MGHLVFEEVLYRAILPAMLNLLALLLYPISPRVIVNDSSPEPIMLGILDEAQVAWLFAARGLVLTKIDIIAIGVIHAVGNGATEIGQVDAGGRMMIC